MWAWILRTAVALGLDAWARRKAGELIVKIEKRARRRIESLAIVQAALPPGGGTAVFKAQDGLTYVVRVERRV
jgi:hypothetical protein